MQSSHKITGGIDGLYVVVHDNTSTSEYINESGVTQMSDIVFSTGTLSIIDVNTNIQYDCELTESDFNDMFYGVNGAIIDVSRIGSPALSVIADGMYNSSLIMNFTMPSLIDEQGMFPMFDRESTTSSDVFYGVIQKKLMTTVISTAWKIVYSNKNPYYDNSLKLKSWFDNMKIAQDLGFYSESLRLLKALQKVLV